VLPWNLRQLISYFVALIIYSINIYITNRQENFATGNAIYLLPRTIIQIANDNSFFRRGNKNSLNIPNTWKPVIEGRQYNGQRSKNKRANNGRHNPTENTKDKSAQAPLQKRLKTRKWSVKHVNWQRTNNTVSKQTGIMIRTPTQKIND
jgi:hypothetical protein